MKEEAKNVYVHPVLIDYIVELARMTRQEDNVSIGVSPRGTLGMLNAARAYAYVAGRDYVVPEDIKILAPVVWAHRIVLQTGYMNMDNKEQIIEAGHMILYKPREMQKYVYYGADQTEVYWVHFTGSNVKNILKEYGLFETGRVIQTGVELKMVVESCLVIAVVPAISNTSRAVAMASVTRETA